MALRFCIGVDIGQNGAIVIQDLETGNIVTQVMPIVGKDVDVHELINILESFRDTDCMVIIEDVRAIFGAAASATFTFGYVAGVTEAALIALKLPYRRVNPKIWQKQAFAGVKEIRKPDTVNKNGKKVKGKVDTKAMALIAAKRLYPNVDLRPTQRSKNPHDGIVDALLMSWYCKQNYK